MKYAQSEEDALVEQARARKVLQPLLHITRRGHAVWLRLKLRPSELQDIARSLSFTEKLVDMPVEVLLNLRHQECSHCNEIGMVHVSVRLGTRAGAMTSKGEPIGLMAPLCKLYEDGHGCYPGESSKHSFDVNDGSGYLVRFELYVSELF